MSEIDTLDEAAQAAAARPPADAFGRVLWGLNALGTLMIAAMMALIVADVVGRSFLNAPINGVAEICAKGIVAIVFLQLPAAVRSDRLVRADFLLARWRARSPRAASLLEVLFAAVGVFVFVVIFRATWPQFAESLERAEFFGVQGVWTLPTWPIRGAILLGCAGAGIAALLHGAVHLRKAFRL
jgi:TRAP-type mannitol/chloroaromatic compound transport system permease small subunit